MGKHHHRSGTGRLARLWDVVRHHPRTFAIERAWGRAVLRLALPLAMTMSLLSCGERSGRGLDWLPGTNPGTAQERVG